MLKLNLNAFFNNNVKFPYNFKVVFHRIESDKDQFIPIKELSEYKVTSIQLPKVEINKDNSLFLGNTRIVYPVYNWASRKLNITFEETDNYEVTSTLSNMLNNDMDYTRPSYNHYAIQIFEYNDTFTTESSRYYICNLVSFDEPKFTRTGNAQQLTINATFNVLSEFNSNEVESYFEPKSFTKTYTKKAEIIQNEDLIGKNLGLYSSDNFDISIKNDSENTETLNNSSSSTATITGTTVSKPTIVSHGKKLSEDETKAYNENFKNAKTYGQLYKTYIANAQQSSSLKATFANENSWMNMAYKNDMTVGEQKTYLKNTYGLTDDDFISEGKLAKAMQNAQNKFGTANGSIWGSGMGCGAGAAWLFQMVHLSENEKMDQNSADGAGDAIAQLLKTGKMKKVAVAGSITHEFNNAQDAENFIREHKSEIDGKFIGISATGRAVVDKDRRQIYRKKEGNQYVYSYTKGAGFDDWYANSGHQVAVDGDVISSDHLQANAIPSVYSDLQTFREIIVDGNKVQTFKNAATTFKLTFEGAANEK